MRTGHASVIVLSLLTCLLGVTTVQAFQAPGMGADLEIAPPAEQTRYLHRADELAANLSAVAYASRLETELGPGWWVSSWNQYAETARSVMGPGLVLAPEGVSGATEGEMEALGRSFIAAHASLFSTDGGNLEVLRITHGAGRWGVLFHQVERGVPVLDSIVLLAIHDNGRLFAFGVNVYDSIADRATTALVPTVERQVAVALARSSVPFDPTAEFDAEPDALLIVPMHQGPGQVEYRLAHRTDVPTSEPIGLWRTYVDAHTGRILYRANEVKFAYEGSSHGDVEIMGYCDGDTPNVPSAHMTISITDVGSVATDTDGNFSIAGSAGSQTYSAQFYGPEFNVNCSGCVDASTSGPIEPDTPVAIYWDAASYRADERDVFYFANITKDYIRSIDPSWSLPRYTATVNINNTCNAYWQGTTINFFRAGGGCANTGTIGSVIAHEYGHGIQHDLLGGQGTQGLGEGNSDIAATFITDDPVIGIGFYNDCNSGMSGRNCDNDLVWPDDLVGQVHADGRIICGFNWDVQLNLQAKMGFELGKAHTAHLWHFSRKLYGYSGMNQAHQAEWYRWIDDDNGNLGDGTPNWNEICEAAEKHGYGCPLNPNRIMITHTPLPDMAAPSGPYTVEAEVQTFIAGTPTATEAIELHYAVNGGAYAMLPMILVAADTYAADIPSQALGSAVAYYIRATHTGGGGLEEFDPAAAPVAHHLFGLGPFTLVADHPMESGDGYSVGAPGDDAIDGVWERGDPIGITLGGALIFQPEDDHTPAPGTDCWVTGNSEIPLPIGEELDGRTSLNVAELDFAGANLLQGHFWGFTYLSVPGSADYLDLNLSTDGGDTWTTIVHIDTMTSPDWAQFDFRLSPQDFDFTAEMRFRFVADDPGGDSIFEALVDDFMVEGLFGGSTAIAGGDSSPLTLSLGHATPNPFNPATTIQYSLPGTSAVRLGIYDVQGRLVRNLVLGMQEPGEHAVDWDGMDTRGSAAASGVYYYKLVVGEWSDTRPMVLLK